MPIVFAQPEPLAPSISQGAGAADQWSRDFPTLERQQTSIADNYIQAARIAAQHSGQVYQAAAAGQQQQAAMQAQANAQGSQQMHQSQMLAQQQSGQAGLQQQHADLQQQLASTALSQGESLRLQRLRSALGSVKEQVDTGNLTADEGNAMSLQIQTGINPLQQRQAAAQQQQMELQRRLMEQHVAQNDRLEHEQATYQNQNAQDHVSIETDGNGVDHSFSRDQQGRRTYLGHRGGPSAVWQPGQPVTGSGQQGGGEGGTGNRAGGGQTGYDHRTHAAALEEARAIAGLDENGKQKPVTAQQIADAEDRILARNTPRERGPDTAAITARVWQEINGTPEFASLPIEVRRQMRDARVTAEVTRLNAPREEQRVRDQEETRVRGEVTRQASRIPVSNLLGGPSVHTAAINETVRRRMEEWDRQRENARAISGQRTTPGEPQPFPMTNDNGPLPEGQEPTVDRSRLTGLQREVMSDFDRFRAMAQAAPGRTGEARASLLHLVDEAQRLRLQYGVNLADMPAADRDRYEQNIALLKRLPEIRAPRQEPRQGREILSTEERQRRERSGRQDYPVEDIDQVPGAVMQGVGDWLHRNVVQPMVRP